MSGTDPTRQAVTETAQPVFVLVRPQLGENIGAACRAMWNFGLDRLRLAAPRDGWPNPRAVAMASGASHVLDRATVHDDQAGALSDLEYVYATTARTREMTKTVFTPAAAMADALARIRAGQKVGVLFGPERTGLESEEVARAQAIISVPANPVFASLNLAQCVLLTAYEWRRQATETPPETLDPGKLGLAGRESVDRVIARLEDELEGANFFFPPEKGPTMRLNIRNLFSRAPLTDQDVRTLHGIIRALAEGPKRRRD
ncbi:RNA methyltransferase [uncultured Albimonas sp.]|uniref:RNA methyltransferase n=1 Tax=uncultured Albimonas sp. TaxID=1331701 RepID=UPI0030EEDFDA